MQAVYLCILNSYEEQKYKEIEIVHRLCLVRISYCVGTRRVKQKQKQTKVFTNLLRGFVDFYSSK